VQERKDKVVIVCVVKVEIDMPLNAVTAYEVVEIWLHSFLTSVLGGVVLTSHLRRFNLWKKSSSPNEQEATNYNP
jgi:hypothetical protein